MTSHKFPSNQKWFRNCGPFAPHHDLDELKRGLAAGRLDEQDEYGMTALALCVSSDWKEGAELLLKAGASTSPRYFRTGETMLYMATLEEDDEMIALLLHYGADPDEPNHWGKTARSWRPKAFKHIPKSPKSHPPAHVQDAEHLAEHHYPDFKIPSRRERESLQPGQAVAVHVYGPKVKGRNDAVKVRITARSGDASSIRYVASIETPLEQTHLARGTKTLEFGPEHVASIDQPPEKKRAARKPSRVPKGATRRTVVRKEAATKSKRAGASPRQRRINVSTPK